jgi:DNA polymerase III sliding clamp (beta) subunit (PCNA family)
MNDIKWSNEMVEPNKILGLAKLAATKDVRYYLNSIYFDKGKLIATNGHVLGILETKLKSDKSFIIPIELIKNIKRSTRTESRLVSIDIHEDNTFKNNTQHIIEISQDGATYTAPSINAKFPDYIKLLPDAYEPEAGFYDIALISKMHEALKLINPKGIHALISSSLESRGGIIKAVDFTGLIMPVRLEKHAKTWSGYTP